MNGPDSYPDVARILAERQELLRIAATLAIRRADLGDQVDPDHLRWCRAFVAANPPLAGPLGTGEPRAPLLLQDECKGLSQWFAGRVDARWAVRQAFREAA